MKKLGIILTLIGSIMIILSIIGRVVGSYQYENEVNSYWELADKSSTVIKKAENIDKFVQALEKSNLKGKYDAIFLKTPNNSFDLNFEALKTLQQRLHEIKDMDVTSFQYQTAIQQITEQEQGEASEMISVFEGVWWKDNYLLLWDWIAFVQVIFCLGLVFTGIIIWINKKYWW